MIAFEAAHEVHGTPWAASPRDVLVRIEAELVTGRELVRRRTMYGVRLPL
ncbi:hypothetical protein [Streptomyces scabiei]|nr:MULTISPECIES: hypothetical protein [Streptomyces]MDW8477409.1 hypothetical protein [Streptomyces scabiei]